MRSVTIVALLLASISVPGSLAAQPNCRKGIPCGNSCIAANKTCRIGSSSTPRTTAPVPAGSALLGATPPDSDVQWVGSVADRVYFVATCSAALDLAPANRVDFASQADAVKLGFRPSRVPGCGAPAAGRVAEDASLEPPDASVNPWVAEITPVGARLYFRNSSDCVEASVIPTANRRYFKDTVQAEAAGYKRSPRAKC